MRFTNLFYLESFFNSNLSRLVTEEYEKNWSSALEVLYNSREYSYKLETGSYEAIFRLHPKLLSKLGPKEKLNLYILLRIIHISQKQCTSLWHMVFDDYIEYLRKINFSNKERYFYLSLLTDEQFLYEMDCDLDPKTSPRKRRAFFRQINSPNRILKLSLLELLISEQFKRILNIYSKTPSKRVQRHKGYRDHGALGSEFSRTLKQQSIDWSIREREAKKEKEKQDFALFLLGLSGRI